MGLQVRYNDQRPVYHTKEGTKEKENIYLAKYTNIII